MTDYTIKVHKVKEKIKINKNTKKYIDKKGKASYNYQYQGKRNTKTSKKT
ncbi:hypothetical protein BRYFOR_05085 [Marvinbryantia formatexigens DSM 14469]|uniref:Uncharacterized protein n=1 Tax=Marvinbryantia formatexigens DSM 14469 TaxID=478749 RepID=C6L8Z6_9FIRM|nr:hypothetical protein BRYFOR_05085 [Marvinbryantia formatexigens DSM 14469]